MRQNSRLPFGNFEQVGSQILAESKHWWFSGRILACHAGGPGSIPGQCSETFEKISIPLCKITLCVAYLQPALAEFVVCLEQNTKYMCQKR